MVEQLATPQTCAVKDLSLDDQIEIRDFAGGPRVVRGGTKITADTMELKLEDADGHIEVADFKLAEEVTVIAKKTKNAKTANRAADSRAEDRAVSRFCVHAQCGRYGTDLPGRPNDYPAAASSRRQQLAVQL